jgi:hypothetical protein
MTFDSEVAYLSRYLVLKAKGVSSDLYTCPEDYALMQAAKYLNVAPWVLQEQSAYWEYRALIAISAETSARKQL